MLLSWGANSDGVLGHNGGIEQLWPLAVEALAGQRIKAVAAGEFHSLCLTGTRHILSYIYCYLESNEYFQKTVRSSALASTIRDSADSLS